MSLELADYLIDLADPAELSKFNTDPESAMKSRNLIEADKVALRSRRSGWIRRQATQNGYPLPQREVDDVECAVLAVDVIEVVEVVDVVLVAEPEDESHPSEESDS